MGYTATYPRPEKTHPTAKNRVWEFFAEPNKTRPANRLQPAEPRREIDPTTTKTVSGVFFYGYRYYDPVTGRWLSRDPIEEAGGLNLYGFVLNRPIDAIDPDGRAVILPLDDLFPDPLKPPVGEDDEGFNPGDMPSPPRVGPEIPGEGKGIYRCERAGTPFLACDPGCPSENGSAMAGKGCWFHFFAVYNCTLIQWDSGDAPANIRLHFYSGRCVSECPSREEMEEEFGTPFDLTIETSMMPRRPYQGGGPNHFPDVPEGYGPFYKNP